VLWLLEEIGAPYDLVVMSREERQGEEHLARHPLGRVPVVEVDGGLVFESAAICLQIGDLHPQAGLLPPPGTYERALAYQWSFFAMTELESPIIQVIEARRDEDEERAEVWGLRSRAAAAIVRRVLESQECLLPGGFSVADVVCGSVLFTGRRHEVLSGIPELEAYLGRLEERPARQRALAPR
jgi:glutathione S-transferase